MSKLSSSISMQIMSALAKFLTRAGKTDNYSSFKYKLMFCPKLRKKNLLIISINAYEFLLLSISTLILIT